MAGGSKKNCRILSDILAAYPGLSYTPSFAEFYGLWLNVDRQERRQIILRARAQWFAGQNDDLEFEDADAAAGLEEEAESIRMRSNLLRSLERIKAARGFQ